MGGKRSQKPEYEGVGSQTVSQKWLHKQDLNNDNHSRHANAEGKQELTGFHP